jgi:hypothetical protein
MTPQSVSTAAVWLVYPKAEQVILVEMAVASIPLHWSFAVWVVV